MRRGFIAMAMILICVFSAVAEDFTIVIDAGHGGKDVGAVDNQVKEKDINLAVALELGKLIDKKLKDATVVYTRDNDTYLTLQQRAEIANKAKGDLFISIHTNSVAMSNKNRRTICGASTYTLGLHKDEDNMEVARRENAVMTLEKDFQTTYQGFNPNSDESYIIFELSQKTNMSQSIKLANGIQTQLAKVAKRQNRGVHQAGFWVLWATSMPAVLVELDFICNPVSAKYLASEDGQKQLAKGIFNAVEAYYKNIVSHSSKKGKIAETTEPEPADDEVTVDDFEAQVVIQSNGQEDSAKKTKAPTACSQQASTSNNTGQRRRRSTQSKQASEQQQYEVAVIKEKKQPYYLMEEGEEVVLEDLAQVMEQSKSSKDEVKKTESVSDESKSSRSSKSDKNRPSSAKLNKKTNLGTTSRIVASVDDKKTDKKSETKMGAKAEKSAIQPKGEVATAQKQSKQTVASVDKKAKSESKVASAKEAKKQSKSTSKSRKSKLNKRTTIYKIHILTCDELLSANDERFAGLHPIKCKFSDGQYHYTYGESQSEKEMLSELETIKKKIPDACVLKEIKIAK